LGFLVGFMCFLAWGGFVAVAVAVTVAVAVAVAVAGVVVGVGGVMGWNRMVGGWVCRVLDGSFGFLIR
jgi:hypothetical protein